MFLSVYELVNRGFKVAFGGTTIFKFTDFENKTKFVVDGEDLYCSFSDLESAVEEFLKHT